MTLSQLLLKNLKKNAKNYYLYIFALIFSVSLYFSFVTLQYDPALDETKGSVNGGAAIGAASVLLIGIVIIFLLYANQFFIRRRSKEIGLFQLIGMTKNKIFRLLAIENFILYFSSLAAGILVGFSFSKLILMILFKITNVDAGAELNFSSSALFQTVLVFLTIFLVITFTNYLFIKRQSILSLFRVTSSTEDKIRRLSFWEAAAGVLGILMIAAGYYVSSKLFDGAFTSFPSLLTAMLFILGSVIIGTYFFYKGSVGFLMNMVRNRKSGYLHIREVLSLATIMYRMKSIALLLTIITTLSALAIGLLSLSYISYYSAEKAAEQAVAADFALIHEEEMRKYGAALTANDIEYKEKRIEVVVSQADLSNIMGGNLTEMTVNFESTEIPVVSDSSVEGVDVSPEETYFTGFSDIMQRFLSIADSGNIELMGKNTVISQHYLGLRREYILSSYFTDGGPVAIVDDSIFQQLKEDQVPDIQKAPFYIGVNLVNPEDIQKADDIFQSLPFSEERYNDSKYAGSQFQKQNMGLIMFIVGFLGLTFLITSGCILYFKQMGEGEDEKPNYTILRKLGFTERDLLGGIIIKQAFSFGIPLILGLLHSYFAVQSGWFLFGTELWTPMILVMLIYTGLYSIFAVLSTLYYKRIIKEAL
ncbi:FtsX-like permease family protein [Bacillus lacus]|uniref:FtsX-like permease family protein n=1 Tax=Metabacillus lacus TaxID=1983721 RepID=A0A7X2IX05_9BACI|nr:ABC transporter permease [Metabacillus lacus]MRX71216.1 FtsX-like permease family protein [Metabacillus lacus]